MLYALCAMRSSFLIFPQHPINRLFEFCQTILHFASDMDPKGPAVPLGKYFKAPPPVAPFPGSGFTGLKLMAFSLGFPAVALAAVAASVRILFMRSSGANGLPFTMPMAAISNYQLFELYASEH